MTGPAPDTDPVRAFCDQLPGRARYQVTKTDRLVVLIHRAIRVHGWTVDQLLTEATRDWGGAANVGGLITYRLERAAEHPPTGPHKPVTLPFCDRVQNGSTCAERRGWLEDSHGRPAGRCPCRTPTEDTGE